MVSSRSLPGAYTAIEIGPSHLNLSDKNKRNWKFKMIINKKPTSSATAWRSCFDLLRRVSRGFTRSKKTLVTPGSHLFPTFSTDFKTNIGIPWNPPNSVELELELWHQFQDWNLNWGSIPFQNFQTELELELMELFQ